MIGMPPAAPSRGAPPPSLIGQPAGFVSRLTALVIDIALLLLALLVSNLLLAALSSYGPVPWVRDAATQQWPGLTPWFVALGALLPTLVGIGLVIGYFLFFLTLTGQTIGKRLVGVRVISTRGGHLTVWQSSLRVIGYFVSLLPLYVGFLAALLDVQRRAWHDRIAGTLVVYVWAARPDERFINK